MIKVCVILREKKLSKDKDNIIPFPGVKLDKMDNDKIDKVNKELLEEKEDINFVENLIDEVAIDLIRRFVDVGINVHKNHFYGDLAFITEIVRGLIYRDMDKFHISQALIDKIITIQHNERGEVQPVINYSKVLEQKDLPGQKLDFGDNEKEILFEPDFELPGPEDEDK